jgi:hypothetical protein
MRARVVVFCAFMIAPTAFAQANDSAVARQLFEEARVLMAKGDYESAERRLESALAHSSGRGIKYQLAVCHEKLGHIARAWALYVDVAEGARAAAETDRERVARAHAAELTPRVPYVRIVSSEEGVTIERDGEQLASWDTPLAIDPGEHVFRVERAGHQPWQTTIDAHEGQTVELRLPALERIVEARITPPAPVVLERPRVERAVFAPRPSSPVRAIGMGTSAAGVLALGVGAGFVIASAATYASSSSMCDASDHCSTQGAAVRGDALTYGDVATVLVVSGALTLAAGVVTWLAAPRRTTKLAFDPILRF